MKNANRKRMYPILFKHPLTGICVPSKYTFRCVQQQHQNLTDNSFEARKSLLGMYCQENIIFLKSYTKGGALKGEDNNINVGNLCMYWLVNINIWGSCPTWRGIKFAFLLPANEINLSLSSKVSLWEQLTGSLFSCKQSEKTQKSCFKAARLNNLQSPPRLGRVSKAGRRDRRGTLLHRRKSKA